MGKTWRVLKVETPEEEFGMHADRIAKRLNRMGAVPGEAILLEHVPPSLSVGGLFSTTLLVYGNE